MKFVIGLVVFLAAKAVLASQVLHCDGREVSAHVDLTIDAAPDNKYAVQLTLTNAAFPQGVSGRYLGSFDSSTHELWSNGIIDASIQSNVVVAWGSDGTAGVVLHADGDRRIESGFGVRFGCQSIFSIAIGDSLE